MSPFNFFLLACLYLNDLVDCQTKDYGVIGILKNYTEFTFGNVNLLISIPHDGNLKPTTIADRDTAGNDVYARNFSQVVVNELTRLFSLKYGQPLSPFTIYNNLDRRKIDVNRGTLENNFCKYSNTNSTLLDDCYRAWLDYHNMIQNNFVTNFMLKSKYVQG